MKIVDIKSELSSTTYPGRGIIIGKSSDGKKAVAAYWTMGRSAGSRNRVFVEDGDGIRTQAFDPTLIAGDPSLIIYAAVRVLGNKTIVTNGDQTDTIYDGLQKGLTFEQSLRSRKYEHDEPNYTPRISSVMNFENGYDYALSILKSDNGNPDNTLRFTYTYDAPVAGEGHYIHTYMGDGNPLPSFEGEPVKVKIETSSIDDLTNEIWSSLNEENKVSLFVRFIDIETGTWETRVLNSRK